jgi:hypothetical protein
MSFVKTSPAQVTKEEIDRAADLWDKGLIRRVIAHQVGWSRHLFDRVVRIARDSGDDYFPMRNKRHSPAEGWCGEALEAAKKPVALTNKAWKRALQESGLKGCTVKARRPSDYVHVPRRLAPCDPTLSLPGPR